MGDKIEGENKDEYLSVLFVSFKLFLDRAFIFYFKYKFVSSI